MINIEDLQQKIDKLLENETKDSLTNWMFSKRFPELNEIIGEGEFVSLNIQDSNETVHFIQEVQNEEPKEVLIDTNHLTFYKLAS